MDISAIGPKELTPLWYCAAGMTQENLDNKQHLMIDVTENGNLLAKNIAMNVVLSKLQLHTINYWYLAAQ